ncbi:DUF4434 domain-containing protein [Paenibacillus elgii]|uniref:DUF4434 domain-containing protein n=1 Tax=Paenibacillus elgii TaxID=189691 RepID=UPI0009EE4A17|nr:DUF4434 domain-containing protein [Paenibacillus elgii]
MKSRSVSITVLFTMVFSLFALAGFNPQPSYAMSTNLLLGKPYTSSSEADAGYPDTNHKELTDGVEASYLLADPAWQGRFNATSYSFTVDLGKPQTFKNFKTNFYKYTGAGVQTPIQVEFSSSTDHSTWITACSVSQQGDAVDVASVPYRCSAASDITARYVKMTVTSAPGTYSFVDEWEVTPAQVSSSIALSGTFLQPYLANQWTDAEWNTEFQKMKDVGINKLILNWTADSKNKTTVYPTTALSGYTQNTSADLVAKALSKGNIYGVDIYFGLQINQDWFVNYANDATWLSNEANISKALVGDLWTKYGTNPSLKGFYLPFEVDNLNLPSTTEWERLISFYQNVGSYIKQQSSSMTVMISPFFNSRGATTANWQTMWEYILSKSPLDIFALQDGIGAGHAETSELDAWFSATKTAINNARPSMQFWDNAETFTDNFKTLDLKTVVADLSVVRPYVSDYISFSFNHYLSPQQVNPLYYATYKDYVLSGALDVAAPTTPAHLSGRAVNSDTNLLNWTPSTDNFGIVGYKIYRNNELVWTAYTNATSFTDSQLHSNTSYRYAVQAFDAAGNYSAQSLPVTVTTYAETNYPTNLASGKKYTSTTPAHPSYPDSGGKLTDGAFGTTASWDEAWRGSNAASPYSFTIDLGSSKSIKEVNANFLQAISAGVLLPETVTFSSSSDNISFKQIGIVHKPAVSSSDQTKTYRLTDLSGIMDRYVKVTIEPASIAWTLIDEIQVKQ